MPGRAAVRITAFVLAVALVACGDDPPPSRATAASSRAETSFPVTVAGTTITDRPERIVSLSATATEDLYAIGAGSQVIAVDDQSDHPPGVPTTRLSAYEPNVEAILSYDPDLVVTASDGGDLRGALDAAGVPVVVMPAATDLDDAYAQIVALGRATGHLDEAESVVAAIREDVEAIVATVELSAPAPTIYHELDDTYYSVTSATFIGQLYALLGLENIADGATGAAGDYPQLSSEFIVEADPDLIFLADTECCGQTPETVASRPGWDGITAVRTGRVIAMDDDVASRWGPRLVDLLRLIADAASKARAAS